MGLRVAVFGKTIGQRACTVKGKRLKQLVSPDKNDFSRPRMGLLKKGDWVWGIKKYTFKI
jgi:hypothetical protein